MSHRGLIGIKHKEVTIFHFLLNESMLSLPYLDGLSSLLQVDGGAGLPHSQVFRLCL
jgi:hypothetical protein